MSEALGKVLFLPNRGPTYFEPARRRPDFAFVGEAPGPNSAIGFRGHSLKRLVVLTGMLDLEARSRFVNLLKKFPGYAGKKGRGGKGAKFPLDRARRWTSFVSSCLNAAPKPRVVVLLGRRVARAYHLEKQPFFEETKLLSHAWPRVVVIPHPSGVNRFWNSVDNVLELQRAMRRLARRAK